MLADARRRRLQKNLSRPHKSIWTPAEKVHRLHLHDHFVVLIEHFTARADDAPVVPTPRQLGFAHSEAPAQGVAWADRLEPTHVVNTRRTERLASPYSR